MAVHASHAALPYPIKNARYSLLVPYLDADGDPTAPTTPDTELSGDNGAAADCAEEASATSGMDGMALLTLSGAETNYSTVGLNAKVASGPKATLATLYPRVLAIIGSGTLSAGSAGGGTLGTLLAYDVTGCFIRTTGGTGGGGTGGANNQARKIITYNTSTGAFTVAPNWETTPSTDTTYDVLLPEGVTLGMLKALNPATPGQTVVVANGCVDADLERYAGTAVDGTNPVPSDPQKLGGNAQSLTDLKDFADTGYDPSTHKVQGLVLADTVTTLTNDPSGVTTLLSRLTSARAGYLDNLNVGGAVASQADITAINQSASRRIIITTVQQYERPESGSSTFQIEARTYDGDGAATNADSAPSLAATGLTSGDLSANLSAASSPSTGVYRWTYTVTSGATLEQIRFDISATISSSIFPLACYAQVCDFVAATFTTNDQSNLTAIFDKLPSKTYLAGTNNSDGDVQIDESTGDFNATQQTRIQTQAAAAVTAYDPPTRTEATSDKAEVLAAVAALPQDNTGCTLDSTEDVYHADIELTIDEANTQDEYTVTWFKNGIPQTSGITTPLIQVIKRADGTDLIASSAMTAIGSTGALKYDASGAERVTNGEAVVVKCTATIDSSARTFERVLGRDASA